MKMSPQRICEYYLHEARDGYAKPAIETLAAINKCQIDEIVAVLQDNGYAKHYYDKKEKETKPMTNTTERCSDERQAIIRDYESGMSCKEIGERHAKNPKVVYQNLSNWAKKGLVTLRAPKKPTHNPLINKEFDEAVNQMVAENKEKEPATAGTVTSSEPIDKSTNTNISPKSEIVKPHNSVAVLTLLTEFTYGALTEQFHDAEIQGVYAEVDTLYAELIFRSDGKSFILQLREKENEQ